MSTDSETNSGHNSLDIRVLGTFLVSVNGRRISDSAWKLKKAKAVVKLLAIAADHRLPRDAALDMLWHDLDPEAALNNLHKALFVARRALEPAGSGPGSFIRFQGDTLSLEAPGELTVDAQRFESLAADAPAEGTLEAYESAIAVYGGQLLPDDLYEDWAISKRDGLQRTCQGLLSEYANLAQASGRHDDAVRTLQQMLELEPGMESAYARLMTLFTQQGDRHRAIRQYQSLTQTLKSEFGLEPQSSTRELYDSIVGGRVALAKAAVPQVTPTPSTTEVVSLEAPRFRPSGAAIAGREDELKSLEPRIRSLINGKGSVILISGPAGAGKSRLAQEIAGVASARGATVMRGGAYEFERQLPYGPFSEAFDDFLGSLPLTNRHTLVDSAPIDVYPLLPRTTQEMGLRHTVTDSHDREFMFSAVETFLRSLSRHSPLVLIVDDLHVADGATLELFHFLARRTSDLPLLIVATYRSEGEAIGSNLSRVLATLGRVGVATNLSLKPLDRSAVQQVVDKTLTGVADDELVSSVFSMSEGNPLFVEETIRTMQETAAIVLEDGKWRLVASLAKVPDAVSQLLNDRFDRLSDTGKQLLSVASAVGI